MALQQSDIATGADAEETHQLERSTEPPPDVRSRRRLGRRARWTLVAGLVLVLVAGGVGAWAVFFRTSTPTTTYRTVTIASETLRQSVSGTGILNPAKESDLSFSSSGTVTSVEVAAGDLVTKGQELATIDDSELEIDYTSAKASLTEAKDALSALEDDSDTTDTALAAAKATVEVKKNAVTQAKAARDDATLVSPIAGKVAAVTIAKGDTVAGSTSTTSSSGSGSSGSGSTGSGTSGTSGTAGSSTGTGSSTSATAAVTVISNGTFTVTTSVSNADVTSVRKGLQATITPTGSTDPVFGTVSSVGVVASSPSSSSTGSATFPVTITVTGKQPTLLPGSSATVAITVKQLTDVLSVPTQAVSTVNGQTVVQKLVDGKQVRTPVKLGASVGASTVVSSGLQAGDQVVLASFRAASGNGSTGTRTGQGGTFGQGQGGYPGGGTFPRQGTGTGTGQGTGTGVSGGTR